MKIRRDYVTNSSSSSFILSFKDEDSIYDTLKEQFPKDIESGWSAGEYGYLPDLLNRISDEKRLTQEDIKEIIEDEERWTIRWELREKYEREKGMSHLESWDFFDSPEGEKLIKEECGKIVEEIMKKIGNDHVIVQVEYGDGGETGEDGVMEHEILPNLDCTIARFSHH